MTASTTWSLRPLSVYVPPGERRNPIAMVRMSVGPLVMVLGVSRLKKTGLMVRPPMTEGGTPAIGATPEVWAEIEKAAIAAVAADPVAGPYLMEKPRRGGKQRPQV